MNVNERVARYLAATPRPSLAATATTKLLKWHAIWSTDGHCHHSAR